MLLNSTQGEGPQLWTTILLNSTDTRKMQSCNRFYLNAFVVFFIIYWILCTSLWIFIKHQQTYIIPLWLSLPLGFWGIALSLFIVLSLLLFFLRCCRSGNEEYETTFEQPKTQTETIRSFECERHGNRLDELESVNLNRPSVDYSFVELAPPRYVNINDITIDERRNDTIAQSKLDGHVDPKTPTLVLMKPPLPLNRNLRKHEKPRYETVTPEDPSVTCIPISTVRSAASVQKTEVFLYVNDASPSTVGHRPINLTENNGE